MFFVDSLLSDSFPFFGVFAVSEAEFSVSGFKKRTH
jgi:hypothetical protein